MRQLALLPLAASLLVAGPLAGAGAAETETYTFGAGSEIDYHVVHPMHHVTGVTHSLQGKVTVTDDHLVMPLTLQLPLISFNSGNANRDNNAAFTLDVTRYPVASLVISSFKETSHSKDAAGVHIAGTASGRLTLHGLSHAVTIPLKGVVSGNKLTADGDFTINLTDYGIPRPQLLFKPIEDAVKIDVHAVASR